jgi:splicing factor 3A subunit 2
LVIAADPYETISFKIPNKPIDKDEDRLFSWWDPDSRIFIVQVLFLTDE